MSASRNAILATEINDRSACDSGRAQAARQNIRILVPNFSFSSRHRYAEAVCNQSIETWLACHCHTFEWLNVVSKKMRIDNLNAAITKGSNYEPQCSVPMVNWPPDIHF
jgi:hypothetical protein